MASLPTESISSPTLFLKRKKRKKRKGRKRGKLVGKGKKEEGRMKEEMRWKV